MSEILSWLTILLLVLVLVLILWLLKYFKNIPKKQVAKMISEDEKPSHTTVKTALIKLIPLWILIAINIAFYYIYITVREPGYGGPWDPSTLKNFYIGAGWVAFDVIYGIVLIVWAYQARRK